MTSPTRQRTHLVLFIILVGYVYPAHAKEKGGGGTSASDAAQAIFGLFQSWNSATFGISIVGEIFALILLKMSIQAFSKYVKLKREGELAATDNRNIGKTFGGLVIAGSLLLVAYYPVFLVKLSNNFADLIFVVVNLGIFEVQVILSGMVILISDMLDIVIASAFLILLRRRQLLHLPETNPRLKTASDAMIILATTALTTVKTTLVCRQWASYHPKSKFYVLLNISHVYTLFYLIVTINIIVSSRFLRWRLARREIQDELISTNMCSDVAFFLGIQAVLRLVDEIFVFLPIQDTWNFNFEALTCVNTAIKFISYTAALVAGIRSFFPRKSSTETVQPDVPQTHAGE